MRHPIPIFDIPFNAEAIIKSRPNRYVGIVNLKSPETAYDVNVHIHDPGRLTELLFPGNQVLLQYQAAEHRKTDWDVLAARYGQQWVLIHSGFHRVITEKILAHPAINPFGELYSVRSEVTYGHSRMDFVLESVNGSEIWIEVKGCTLAIEGVALFPDAPTKRGSKHLQTLMDLKAAGKKAAMIILIFRADAQCFAPNTQTDLEFSRLFYKAIRRGVSVYPLVLSYENGCIFFREMVPVKPLG